MIFVGRIATAHKRSQQPIGPHYVFLDLDSDAAVKRSPVRKLLERVTGMPTVIGTDITEPPLQDSIIRTISGAQLVVADITDLRDGEHDPKRFNLDVCMEVAICPRSPRRRDRLDHSLTGCSPSLHQSYRSRASPIKHTRGRVPSLAAACDVFIWFRGGIHIIDVLSHGFYHSGVRWGGAMPLHPYGGGRLRDSHRILDSADRSVAERGHLTTGHVAAEAEQVIARWVAASGAPAGAGHLLG
jgi:hypothetical protein